MLGQTFAKACGPMGAQALGVYCILVKVIAMSGRRRLKVHVPGCPCVSTDEKAIVGVIAAAQASLEQSDETLLRLRLQFLVESAPQESLVFAAQAVARVFEAGGHRLPTGIDPERLRPAGPPHMMTVH